MGQTPPCTEALIAAGVARVVVARRSRPARGWGRVARLRAAGIDVATGCWRTRRTRAWPASAAGAPGPAVGDAEAGHHAGWPDRHRGGREPVDHRRRGARGGACPARPARRGAGRRRHGAGRRPGADLPHAGLSPRPPVRIVVDSHLRTPADRRLVATAASDPTWFLHRMARIPTGARRFASWACGCSRSRAASGRGPGGRVAGARRAAGLTRVLVEGGAQMAAACCGPGWSTASRGSMPRRSWAATAGRRCRRSASRHLPRCRASRARRRTRGRRHVDRIQQGGLMFTGIITALGDVRSHRADRRRADMRLVIEPRPGRIRRSPSARRSPAPAAA